jgi:SAM-dependent methyltransferase
MTAREKWFSAQAYEPYVGRWSRVVAKRFLDWLAPAPDREWIDVGCGTGALSGAILDRTEPKSLLGIDPSPVFVSYAHDSISDPRARFTVGDARDLPVDGDRFDHVVSGLALNFVPDTGRALEGMGRVARSGGTIAAYVWDYSERMQMMRYFWKVATDLHPEARALDEAARFEDVCNPEGLTRLWNEANLGDVEVAPIEIDTVFENFQDYWGPFLGGQGPAPTFAMSLSQQERERLARELEAALPTENTGRIPLKARAWAVRGTR